MDNLMSKEQKDSANNVDPRGDGGDTGNGGNGQKGGDTLSIPNPTETPFNDVVTPISDFKEYQSKEATRRAQQEIKRKALQQKMRAQQESKRKALQQKMKIKKNMQANIGRDRIDEQGQQLNRSMSILSNAKLNTSLSSEAQKQISKKVEQMTKKLVIKQPEVAVNVSNLIVKRSFSDLYQDKSISDQLKFVTNRVKPNTNAKVPDTVRALDNYCQRFGYLSMGQVIDAPGKYYLGRRITNGKQGKIQYVVPHFEKSLFVETPDIGKNLCHFANKAVNKWNDYSKAEGQLQVYVNLIKQTPIQDYEQMTVRKCSFGTTIYKILATLFYFYIERKENILNLTMQNRDMLEQILNTRGTMQLQNAYAMLLEVLRDQPDSNLNRFIKSAKQEVKMALIASTGAQSQGVIDAFINDPNAYLDPSMMKNPRRETPKWIQKFSGQKSFANLFTTQKWEPHSEYMKPDNYFNF